MKTVRPTILPIVAATIWISGFEFLRNQVLLLHYWTDHYASLGLTFSTKPLNGMIWGIWSLVFAMIIYVLSRRFSLRETFVLGWTIGFVLMWLVIGNLGVLPTKLLIFAIPMSMLEVYVAQVLIARFDSKQK